MTTDSRVNGVPTRIWRFDSQTGQVEIEAFYRSHWGAFDPVTAVQEGQNKGMLSERTAKGETLLSRFHGPFFITIKVKPLGSGASTGLISVALLQSAEVRQDLSGLPIPPNATPLSVVESADGKRISKLAHLLVPSDLQVLRLFFETRGKESGWTLMDVFQLPAPAGAGHSVAMIFHRGDQELNVMMSRPPRQRISTVQVNHIQPRS